MMKFWRQKMSKSIQLPRIVFFHMLNFYRFQYIGGAFEERILATPEHMKNEKRLGLVTPLSVETPITLGWYLLTPKTKTILDTYREHGLTIDDFYKMDSLENKGFQEKLYQLRFNL